MEFLEPSDPLLQQSARLVPTTFIPGKPIQGVVDEMHEFATGLVVPNRHGGRLVGLAAPQVGVDYAIALVDLATPEGWSGKLRVLINPRIVRTWGPQTVKWWHGCYSTGDLVTIAELPRFMEIEYFDRYGAKQTWVIDGVVDGARLLHVVWHEVRHLFGLRHVDYALQMRTPIYVMSQEERSAFHTEFMDTGTASCPRQLAPVGWRAMRAGWEWQSMIIEPKAS